MAKTRENADIRHKGATITAIAAFIIGWGLTIAGFIVEPTGEVSGSVLAILGEAMVYAASVFGVTLYFNSRIDGFRQETRRYLDEIERRSGSPSEEGDGEV